MVRVKLFPAAQQHNHETYERISLYKKNLFFFFGIILQTILSLVCNNTSLVQLQIITGFLSRCSLWIKGKREKKKRPPLLMAWLRIWFRLLREYVPDCPKGLTAIVYCSTRQDLAPICIKVRAERGGRVHRAAAPVLVLGTEKDISCFKKRDCVGGKGTILGLGNWLQKWNVSAY